MFLIGITLKFLGDDVGDEMVTDIGAAVGRVCAGHAPFDAGLSGLLGAFPSEERARVLWAGVGAGGGELRALAAGVGDALAPLGFAPKERTYEPHLTLGRVRGRPINLFPLPRLGDLPGFRVERVELVRSTPGSGGSAYETLETFVLGG